MCLGLLPHSRGCISKSSVSSVLLCLESDRMSQLEKEALITWGPGDKLPCKGPCLLTMVLYRILSLEGRVGGSCIKHCLGGLGVWYSRNLMNKSSLRWFGMQSEMKSCLHLHFLTNFLALVTQVSYHCVHSAFKSIFHSTGSIPHSSPAIRDARHESVCFHSHHTEHRCSATNRGVATGAVCPGPPV